MSIFNSAGMLFFLLVAWQDDLCALLSDEKVRTAGVHLPVLSQ